MHKIFDIHFDQISQHFIDQFGCLILLLIKHLNVDLVSCAQLAINPVFLSLSLSLSKAKQSQTGKARCILM